MPTELGHEDGTAVGAVSNEKSPWLCLELTDDQAGDGDSQEATAPSEATSP